MANIYIERLTLDPDEPHPFRPLVVLPGMADTRDTGCIGKGSVCGSIPHGSTTKTPFR